MSTLMLDHAHMSLRCDGQALAVYQDDERRGSVPLALLSRCVIRGADTQLDSGVLLRLAEAGVATVLFSPRLGRRVALVLGPQHQEAAVRLAQSQRTLNECACLPWAHSLVAAKLARQRRVQQHWARQRPDQRHPLAQALGHLEAAQAQVQHLPRAAANATQAAQALARLRGLEGAGARAHFQALAAVLPPALGFQGRNRRPPRDPVNVLLSLGYTMLHLEAVGLAQAAGLDPLLGFYHRPSIGRESLACDLIEPLRPQVDAWAHALVRDQHLRASHFTNPTPDGACVLGKAGRHLFYDHWFQALPPWRRWLRARAAALATQLRLDGEILLSDPGHDDDDSEPC